MVISNPTPIANEAELVNGLFDEGLEVLHLRKPEATVDDIQSLLKQINSKYHHQIALHQHHEIADDEIGRQGEGLVIAVAPIDRCLDPISIR